MSVIELTTKYNKAHKALVEARNEGASQKKCNELYLAAKKAQSALLLAMKEANK